MTRKEVCGYAQILERTLHRLTRQGRLKRYRIPVRGAAGEGAVSPGGSGGIFAAVSGVKTHLAAIRVISRSTRIGSDAILCAPSTQQGSLEKEGRAVSMVRKPDLKAVLEWVELLTNSEILQFRQKLNQVLAEHGQATIGDGCRLPQKPPANHSHTSPIDTNEMI